jgi:hypothetical protein
MDEEREEVANKIPEEEIAELVATLMDLTYWPSAETFFVVFKGGTRVYVDRPSHEINVRLANEDAEKK